MKKIVKENKLYIFVIIMIIFIFLGIYHSPLYFSITNFDYVVRNFVDSIRNGNLTVMFNIFTFIGDLYIPLLIIVCVFITFKNKWYPKVLLSSYVFVGVIIFISKNLIMRARPLEAIIAIPSSYSFPSGHTLSSVVFYLTLWYIMTLKSKRLYKLITGILFIVIVIMIGLSRVYLGVHFFSDVVGGFILSIPCLLMLKGIIDKHYKSKLKKELG